MQDTCSTPYSAFYSDQEAFNRFNPLENMATGDFGVAKYSDDDHWYRAWVVKREGSDQIRIVYIDFGNIATKSLNEFFLIERRFTEIPAQAIACTLSEVRDEGVIENEDEFNESFSSTLSALVWKGVQVRFVTVQ